MDDNPLRRRTRLSRWGAEAGDPATPRVADEPPAGKDQPQQRPRPEDRASARSTSLPTGDQASSSLSDTSGQLNTTSVGSAAGMEGKGHVTPQNLFSFPPWDAGAGAHDPSSPLLPGQWLAEASAGAQRGSGHRARSPGRYHATRLAVINTRGCNPKAVGALRSAGRSDRLKHAGYGSPSPMEMVGSLAPGGVELLGGSVVMVHLS